MILPPSHSPARKNQACSLVEGTSQNESFRIPVFSARLISIPLPQPRHGGTGWSRSRAGLSAGSPNHPGGLSSASEGVTSLIIFPGPSNPPFRFPQRIENHQVIPAMAWSRPTKGGWWPGMAVLRKSSGNALLLEREAYYLGSQASAGYGRSMLERSAHPAPPLNGG